MRASTYLSTFMLAGAFASGAACSPSVLSTQSSGAGGGAGGSTSGGDHGGAGTTTTGTTGSSNGGATGATTTTSTAATTTSSTSSSTTTSSGATDTKFPFPTVVYGGAPLVLAPKVVTITFPGDSLAGSLSTFGDGLTSTPYWTSVTSEYCSAASSCIGQGTGTTVALTTAPAASYTDSTTGGASSLQTFLAGLITSGKVPAATADTIYALYFPSTVSISLDGATSCSVFGGYHSSMTMGSETVIYAVIDECPPQTGAKPATLLEETTISGSHEVVEASTNPVNTQQEAGFYLDFSQQNSIGWNNVGGGEIGDLCVDPFGLGQDETLENGYTVQRIWSATNAKAGKNPCVPIPTGEVYFNAFPTVSAVVVDVGQSKTIEVDALADGAMGAWTVGVQDATNQSGTTPYLSFTIPGSVNNPQLGPTVQMTSGSKIEVTVTLEADPGSTPDQVATGIMLSLNSAHTAAHYWPFIALTPAEASTDGITMMKKNAARRHMIRRNQSRVLTPFLNTLR